MKTRNRKWQQPSPRGMVLGILGVITLGVAALSVAVSYQILQPRFGGWAVPTVGALDALWCVFQATEILSGNNKSRIRRVQWAGIALTAVNAAIPTVDLALRLRHSGAGFDLAVVIAPIAIVATKGAWWIALPALGRKVSPATRRIIAERRQTVADQLEKMEADTADRIELLALARDLNERVAEAETAYRLSVLKTQQTMTEDLHEQAAATAATVAEQPLPAMVAAITLPDFATFTAAAPALPGTPGGTARHTEGTQVNALSTASGTGNGTPGGTGTGTPAHTAAHTVPLERLASVAGVPVPQTGEQLTDAQIGVVLRHLRYADDPPMSFRQARSSFRGAGYQGSEERIRHAWAVLRANEGHGEMTDTDTDDEATEGADA
ncbi:hypothetical protein [Streptomyces sp. IBSBF 3136]|uniref:hypothetical protein n=1 Tax=Streptomyces sp. IBSBF 3136 TaxID=2903524 RepID=UPI002FDC5A81